MQVIRDLNIGNIPGIFLKNPGILSGNVGTLTLN